MLQIPGMHVAMDVDYKVLEREQLTAESVSTASLATRGQRSRSSIVSPFYIGEAEGRAEEEVLPGQEEEMEMEKESRANAH